MDSGRCSNSLVPISRFRDSFSPRWFVLRVCVEGGSDCWKVLDFRISLELIVSTVHTYIGGECTKRPTFLGKCPRLVWLQVRIGLTLQQWKLQQKYLFFQKYVKYSKLVTWGLTDSNLLAAPGICSSAALTNRESMLKLCNPVIIKLLLLPLCIDILLEVCK